MRVGDRVVSGAGISCGSCLWCLARAARTSAPSTARSVFRSTAGSPSTCTSPAAICRHVPDACDDDAAAMTQPLAVALHALSRVAQRSDEASP